MYLCIGALSNNDGCDCGFWDHLISLAVKSSEYMYVVIVSYFSFASPYQAQATRGVKLRFHLYLLEVLLSSHD